MNGSPRCLRRSTGLNEPRQGARVRESTTRGQPVFAAADEGAASMRAFVNSVSQADPAAMTRLRKGLNEFLERDRDRALFDLAPRPKEVEQ